MTIILCKCFVIRLNVQSSFNLHHFHTIAKTCEYMWEGSQVSNLMVGSVTIDVKGLCFNHINITHILCRLAHRSGVLKGCFFVFCYCKFTNFFGHLQVFWYIYIDKIGLFVDMFRPFVGKKRLFR